MDAMTGRRTLSLPRRDAAARIGRIVPLVVAGLLALLLALELVAAQHPGGILSGAPGFDFATYMEATRRWLSGASFYAPYQLAAPYLIQTREILYPPTLLVLLVPFTVLPAVLWWILPLGAISWVLAWHRPSRWGWAAILAVVILPAPFDWHFSLALEMITTGNPDMWIAAAVALGTVWGWPAILVALKPTLAPFMLLGIRRRSWWLAAGLLALVSLAFLPMWFDYLTALRNARGPLVSPLYSLKDVPLMLVPTIAWLTRRATASCPEPGDADRPDGKVPGTRSAHRDPLPTPPDGRRPEPR